MMRRILVSLLVVSAAGSLISCKAPERKTGTVERAVPQDQSRMAVTSETSGTTGTTGQDGLEKKTGTTERGGEDKTTGTTQQDGLEKKTGTTERHGDEQHNTTDQ